jgi:hypothetical protein
VEIGKNGPGILGINWCRLTLKISSDQIWVASYFGQHLTYPNFTIFSSDFLCNSLKSSIIYGRVFLNCLCVAVHGWSSTLVPPGIVLLPTILPRVRGEPGEEGSAIDVDGA